MTQLAAVEYEYLCLWLLLQKSAQYLKKLHNNDAVLHCVLWKVSYRKPRDVCVKICTPIAYVIFFINSLCKGFAYITTKSHTHLLWSQGYVTVFFQVLWSWHYPIMSIRKMSRLHKVFSQDIIPEMLTEHQSHPQLAFF